ncbi:MAG: short-chain dehydrogenase/reductase [Subtercola sp.]|nr:short-chain dehydrogenase/reductase [Subtercola sp.]
MTEKVWFITGTARGFGRHWTQAALERGDKVAATARNADELGDLVEKHGDSVLPLTLDVTDREACRVAIARTHEKFGRIDVLVNNVGFSHFGFIEELTEGEVRSQFETNTFGSLWLSQAVIPIMRTQGSGHIIQVSSIAGILAFPRLSMYNGSKWAIEGITLALAQEVAPFGIDVTLIEPGSFSTGGRARSTESEPMAIYEERRAAMTAARDAGVAGHGNPDATAAALLALVDADAPPLRVFFGAGLLPTVTAEYTERLATWQKWQHISELAQG